MAVVFDLFHTLVDPEPFKPAAFDAVGEVARLLDVDVGSLRRFWSETEVEQETTTVELVDLVERHAGALGRSLTGDERDAVDAILGTGKDESIRNPPPALVSLVAGLASQGPVGVLSNCETREVRAWVESPYRPHVSALVRSCDHGCMKPDAAIYLEVLRRLDVAAEDATYVANGSSDELGGARRVGFGRVVHMNAFDRLHGMVPLEAQRARAAQADLSVDTIDGLVAALAG